MKFNVRFGDRRDRKGSRIAGRAFVLNRLRIQRYRDRTVILFKKQRLLDNTHQAQEPPRRCNMRVNFGNIILIRFDNTTKSFVTINS